MVNTSTLLPQVRLISIQKWWAKNLSSLILLHLGEVKPAENTAWVENREREGAGEVWWGRASEAGITATQL